jgi:hypothetical protein
MAMVTYHRQKGLECILQDGISRFLLKGKKKKERKKEDS